jgi:hypothetical protein
MPGDDQVAFLQAAPEANGRNVQQIEVVIPLYGQRQPDFRHGDEPDVRMPVDGEPRHFVVLGKIRVRFSGGPLRVGSRLRTGGFRLRRSVRTRLRGNQGRIGTGGLQGSR